MTKLQFRVLYREFLFRMVDLELLSPEGDITQLLGRFAGILVFISSIMGFGAMLFNTRRMTPEKLMLSVWSTEHSLIALTMLVVGLFAVLSWDSTFPNRRDVLVLSPLPVHGRTMFLAKVAAVASALGLTVGALHLVAGFLWPLHFIPEGGGLVGLIRSVLAYWATMLASGAFVYCTLLGVQGLAAQLPRQIFLRLSAWLQMGAFCLFICLYMAEPALATPRALTDPHNQRALAWLPSYWFLGLFQALNGSMHPAIRLLAWRAFAGLAIAGTGAGVAFLLSYFRTLRRIVEEPDIAHHHRGLLWTPRFGNPLETAVVLFSARTLLRSRQHRVILAFYLGIGLPLVIALARSPGVRQLSPEGIVASQASVPLLGVSILMMFLWVVGTRVVFSMPLDLRANWIFRVAPIGEAPQCLRASRRALLVTAVTPAAVVAAAIFLWLWPWRPAVGHLAVFGVLGMIVADVFLYGFQKIPFTCSYLPGKSNLQLALWAGAPLLFLIFGGAQLEKVALVHPFGYAAMMAILAVAAGCARWRTSAQARSEESAMQFDEVPVPTVQLLGLQRDGV